MELDQSMADEPAIVPVGEASSSNIDVEGSAEIVSSDVPVAVAGKSDIVNNNDAIPNVDVDESGDPSQLLVLNGSMKNSGIKVKLKNKKAEDEIVVSGSKTWQQSQKQGKNSKQIPPAKKKPQVVGLPTIGKTQLNASYAGEADKRKNKGDNMDFSLLSLNNSKNFGADGKRRSNVNEATVTSTKEPPNIAAARERERQRNRKKADRTKRKEDKKKGGLSALIITNSHVNVNINSNRQPKSKKNSY